jgi:hypothetical protein
MYLSPEHGLNPSLEQCFVCMKDVRVILFGRMKGDAEAPRRVCLDKEPCADCKKWMEQGVVLISVDEEKSKGDMQNPYRTGGWIVVRDDFIERVVQPEELRKAILKKRMAFIPDEAWDMLGLPRGESRKEEAR